MASLGLPGYWASIDAIVPVSTSPLPAVAMAGLPVGFTHTSIMHSIFDSTHLTPLEWLKVLGAGLLVFTVAELEKFVIRRTPLASRVVQA